MALQTVKYPEETLVTLPQKKVSLSTLQKKNISNRVRRINFPILTLGALAIGLHLPVQRLIDGQRKGSVDALIWHYTGYNASTKRFELRGIVQGLLPLAAVMLLNKSGLFRPVNAKLARARIPLRLS